MLVIAESNSLYVGDMLFYLISFILTALLVWHYVWKPVTGMMEKRAKTVAQDIDSAKQARMEATELAAKRKAQLEGSQAEAAQIVDQAKKSAQTQGDQIVAAAQADAQNLKEQAQRDAKQAREDALRGAKDDVANLSIEIASKLIQKQLNADDQKALIDSYIEGLVKHES
ncbi:F0F1 ATP synthase subunit B [Limosilactobacillus ingluviei]|mgnify:CR=1 FL=1|uniref:ATP synthase subunit b n=2 Tax=Limosilactobacillus ingluviei TaxID=148604 RepID=A0A0R2H4R6_9LACO|nr:F0F1 ATP synthase subunit B [Limosilactobacillus ingluviei]KRL92094.1 ATP synthase subunit b [Limosilactobacillus ingluviei DSM 15946]KRN44842.1 ATP synthase subunit b [Limosilactobacillus ingluviei]MBM6728210.1 F0F1 ATP synthase subunit B [Limosilactobacillus ingluviei]MDO4603088.1 F0F1 ATP synthase subunit B [Limosilactobacillus ingluviei]HJG49599.1 F0F1 ATP synthase subunit B [Limosilactobacillus ingluviei]